MLLNSCLGLQSYRNSPGLQKRAWDCVGFPASADVLNLLVNPSSLATKSTFVKFRTPEQGVPSIPLELVLRGLGSGFGADTALGDASASIWDQA